MPRVELASRWDQVVDVDQAIGEIGGAIAAEGLRGRTVMGHEQASTTLDLYTHQSGDRNRRILSAFADY
jgi:hypothetical protein